MLDAGSEVGTAHRGQILRSDRARRIGHGVGWGADRKRHRQRACHRDQDAGQEILVLVEDGDGPFRVVERQDDDVLGQDLLLGREVVVHRGRGHLDRRRDVLDGHLVDRPRVLEHLHQAGGFGRQRLEVGEPVDQAVTLARQATRTAAVGDAWSTPALFVGDPDQLPEGVDLGDGGIGRRPRDRSRDHDGAVVALVPGVGDGLLHVVPEVVVVEARDPQPVTIEQLERDVLVKILPLHEAVWEASKIVLPGDVVLLSPGGTSYDEFRDFEERGECFKQQVMKL